MPTGKAPPPSHRKACWSSRRCTSPTPVSGAASLCLSRWLLVSVWDFYLSASSSGLHPHQSGGPIANPALYGGPPVSLSPGQPQQLLPPPFYPPPGVMTFPYPTMYPSPQVHTHCSSSDLTHRTHWVVRSVHVLPSLTVSDISQSPALDNEV